MLLVSRSDWWSWESEFMLVSLRCGYTSGSFYPMGMNSSNIAAGTAVTTLIAALAIAASFLPSRAAGGQTQFTGLVMSVNDGDTLRALHPVTGTAVVRLSDIDAPETSHGKEKPGQPFSTQAKRKLMELVLSRVASFTCYEPDTKFNRLVCRVDVGGQDVGDQLLEAGLAWPTLERPAFIRGKHTMRLYGEARAARTGLWSDKKPVAPWVWRRDCWTGGFCEKAEH